MEFTFCLNDCDIEILRSAIAEQRDQLREEMRELKRIGEHEECQECEQTLSVLAATEKKLVEVLRVAPS